MNHFIEALYESMALWQAYYGNFYTLLAITQRIDAYPIKWLNFKYSADIQDYVEFYNRINAIVLETNIYNSDNSDNKQIYKSINPAFKKIHFNLRFHLNKQPLSLYDILDRKEKWTLLPIKSSAFHMNGKDGEYNLKFISKDGHLEAVYSSLSYSLVINPWNIGTYNYAPLTDSPNHYTYDVEPYYKWNNTPFLKGQGQIASNIMAGENILRYNQSSKAQENYNKIKELFNS
ncbi:MAG: hypothetical protein WC996_02300 [Peptostreptococcales bacterium]